MASESEFTNDLLRLIAGELYFLLALTASREMYGKSYFALGIAEKQAVDAAVSENAIGNYFAGTPDFFVQLKSRQKAAQTVGFQAPPR